MLLRFLAAVSLAYIFIAQSASAMDAGNLKKLDDLDQLHTSIKPFQLSNPEAFFDYRSGILKNGFFELQRWDECATEGISSFYAMLTHSEVDDGTHRCKHTLHRIDVHALLKAPVTELSSL